MNGTMLPVGASDLREEDSAMQATRVAAVSMNGLLGQSERVLAAIDGWCERAATAKADLVLFPELVVHGHCTPNTWELAEPVPYPADFGFLLRQATVCFDEAIEFAQNGDSESQRRSQLRRRLPVLPAVEPSGIERLRGPLDPLPEGSTAGN